MFELLIGLCLALPGASEANAEERLPGSGLTASDALDRSDLVVVARVTDEGRGGGISGMGEHFSAVRIEVLDRLKGESAKELTLTLKVQFLPEGRSERAPEGGREYLFFLKRPNEKQVWTIKVVRPTGPMLRRVKELLERNTPKLAAVKYSHKMRNAWNYNDTFQLAEAIREEGT